MSVFRAGGGLNPHQDKDIIVKRREFDQIINHIESEDLYIAIRSPRQTGKTTLLFQAQAYLNSTGYGVAYVDLSDFFDLSKEEFYQILCKSLCSSFNTVIVENQGAEALKPEDIKNQFLFSDFLKYLSESTPTVRKLVLVLDEIGGVPQDAAKTFFSTLRKVFHRGKGNEYDRELFKKISFIFSGSLDLMKLTQGKNSPLKNICETILLEDFDRIEVEHLCSNLYDYSPEVRIIISKSVYEWCAGHPYLTQRLLKIIADSKICIDKEVNRISETIDNVVEASFFYDENEDSNLSHILSYINEVEASCRDSIFKILNENTITDIIHDEDLFVVGIIRRLDDKSLAIRNRIYAQILQNLFSQK